jgi:hypothetical protein
METDGHTGEDIAKYLGVSRATLYRYLSERGAARGPRPSACRGCRLIPLPAHAQTTDPVFEQRRVSTSPRGYYEAIGFTHDEAAAG